MADRSGLYTSVLHAELQGVPYADWLQVDTLLRHRDVAFELEIEMTRNMIVGLYVAALIVTIVSVDLLFFKDRFWERLMVNIGIVLIFTAFYLRFLKSP